MVVGIPGKPVCKLAEIEAPNNEPEFVTPPNLYKIVFGKFSLPKVELTFWLTFKIVPKLGFNSVSFLIITLIFLTVPGMFAW